MSKNIIKKIAVACCVTLTAFGFLAQSHSPMASAAAADETVATIDQSSFAEATDPVIARALPCGKSATLKGWTVHQTARSRHGNVLWRYYSHVDWCFNGVNVTKIVSRQNWGTVHTPLWSYAGSSHLGNGTVGTSSWYTRDQGHFKLACTAVIGCLQQSYPVNKVTVRGNGSGSASFT